MTLPTSAGIRRLIDEGVDTRVALLVYAAVTLLVGFNMTGTGIRGVDRLPLAYESIIWIAGMAVAAAGCAAVGLSLNDDPIGRQRSVRWFAAGHLLLGLMLWMQWGNYWGAQGLPQAAALAPLIAGIALMAVTIPGRLQSANDATATTVRRIRSTYDEHIRQIARREERARLARDLHDAVKQQLFVIQTAAATVEARFDGDADGAREALVQVRAAARDATAEMEALLDELQASPMEYTGLVEALKKQCEALALRTGADVSFEPGPPPPTHALRPGAHDAIYRVAQEALANVARHARASRVTVSLQAGATGVELRVSDNGTGLDPGAARRGMGLSNMEARAAETGGRVSITPRSPGTEVVLSVPLTPLTPPIVRVAWVFAAGVVGLALSHVVFYGIMGDVSDRPAAELHVRVWAVLVALFLAAAYVATWLKKAR